MPSTIAENDKHFWSGAEMLKFEASKYVLFPEDFEN
jgi:hypothetical protein